MKVLILSLAYHPFIGGAEVAIKELTDRLPDINFDMVTVNLDGQQQKIQRSGNINIYRIGKSKLSKYFFPYSGFKLAKKLHQEKQYDVVWSMMANQSGIIALKMKNEFPDLKYLLTLQEGDSLARIWSRTWFMRRAYKNIYKKADLVQAISNYLAQRAKKYGYKGEVKIVPNGVDLNLFNKSFSDDELNEFRAGLNISRDDKVVVTTSRLVYKNGLDSLIQSVKSLPVKVLILGSGPLESKLKALAHECEVKDKILFVGHVDQLNMIKYLKISDVFVRASRSEGLGSSFLEAMAAGLPIIGTRVGGIVDFLKDGETGLFCEVDNPSDLASKIKLLIDDEDLRQRIVNNGQNLVLQSYDWNQITDEMKNIFNTL